MGLSENEARGIADSLLSSAQAIDDYLDEKWETISRPEYETMNEAGRTLLRISSFCTTEAVGVSIDEMENPANELDTVIKDAKEKLATLQETRLAINVAAGLADLATSIVSKDAGSVLKAAKNLKKLVS